MIRCSLRRWRCLAVAAAVCLSAVSYGQTDVPDKAKVVQQMRMLYYTPTTAGLRSVSCDVKVDWHGILQSAAAGKDVAMDDPRVIYLNQVKISFRLTLDGASKVNWTAPSGTYPGGDAALHQMEDGTQQTLGGFSKLWVIFLNGTFLPAPNEGDFHLTRADDGLLLTLGQKGISLEEKLLSDYTLEEYHGKTGGQDVDFFPIFAKTSEGLLLTGLEGTYGSGGPGPVRLKLRGQYQEAGGFQVLRSLNVTVLNLGQFNFTFENCRVNQSASDAVVTYP
jgi:hypothetical protein